jgi:cytochrome c-type biogenesis protein CcmH/NrfG
MFADPYLLEKSERATLVAQLREVVSDNAETSELRVLLGMALCVNFEVPDAIEELNEAVRLAPQSYIAHLKAGELWMRLRVVGKAEEHTRQAALLASNMAQSELARRQAATIRTMRRNGIERGIQSCKTPGRALASIARRFWKKRSEPAESSVALDLT